MAVVFEEFAMIGKQKRAEVREEDPKKRCPYCEGTVEFTIPPGWGMFYVCCSNCRRSGTCKLEDSREARFKT